MFEKRGSRPYRPGLYLLLGRFPKELARAAESLRAAPEFTRAGGVVHDRFGAWSHHETIEEEMGKLREADVPHVLVTMNPVVIDALPIDEAGREAEERLLFVGVGAEIMNLDADAALSFARAYRVGIQQISEVVRAKGFW